MSIKAEANVLKAPIDAPTPGFWHTIVFSLSARGIRVT